MYIVKNLKENKKGNISCERLDGEIWKGFTMPPSAKYEIHEDSDWPDIKLCDQATKTAHEQAEARAAINQKAMSYLKSTDWYVLRAMDSGEPMPDDIKLARAEAREKIAV